MLTMKSIAFAGNLSANILDILYVRRFVASHTLQVTKFGNFPEDRRSSFRDRSIGFVFIFPWRFGFFEGLLSTDDCRRFSLLFDKAQ